MRLDDSFLLVDQPTSPLQGQSHKGPQRKLPSQSYAHDWSPSTTGKIALNGRHFVDQYGRVCNLRGVNLSGSCKSPSSSSGKFPHDEESVTFVGRPFPLQEAHEHFSRLRRWGLSFIRFLVTWEALEHAGPGIYDIEYLEYLRALLSMLPSYGISAVVSMHQDVWSRYTGGSGAPAWTLKVVGLDVDALEETGAAWLRGVQGGGHSESEMGVWPCGYQKLAASTMATCFWGGDTFAPKVLVGENQVPVQQYLQGKLLDAWDVLVKAIGDLDGVLGFQMMNEPHAGYIGLPSMHYFDYNTDLHLAHVPSALQSFALGAGHPTSVPHYTRSFPFPSRLTSHVVLNPSGKSVWLKSGPTKGQCIWELHNVWGWDRNNKEALVLRESYFVRDPNGGKKIDWYSDFYYPLLMKWANRVQNIAGKDKLIFTEGIPNEFCPASWTPDKRPHNMVFAPHWYDLDALFKKQFGNFTVNVQGLARGMPLLQALYWGQKGAKDNYSLQIRNIVQAGYKNLGNSAPVFIGECGVPMDLNRGQAFKSDDWTWQARMMDALITALDRSLVGFTLWNYNPYNLDDSGDDWNGENFSWFSRARALETIKDQDLQGDQLSSNLDHGGRILRSLVRPYPAKTAGTPLRFEYDMNNGSFVFEWVEPDEEPSTHLFKALHPTPPSPSPWPASPSIEFFHKKSHQTEIFLPSLISRGRKVEVHGLDNDESSLHNENLQTLVISTKHLTPRKRHVIEVSVYPPLKPVFEVNDFWGDFKGIIVAILVLILALATYYFAFKQVSPSTMATSQDPKLTSFASKYKTFIFAAFACFTYSAGRNGLLGRNPTLTVGSRRG